VYFNNKKSGSAKVANVHIYNFRNSDAWQINTLLRLDKKVEAHAEKSDGATK
jgi:hypothetical protein